MNSFAGSGSSKLLSGVPLLKLLVSWLESPQVPLLAVRPLRVPQLTLLTWSVALALQLVSVFIEGFLKFELRLRPPSTLVALLAFWLVLRGLLGQRDQQRSESDVPGQRGSGQKRSLARGLTLRAEHLPLICGLLFTLSLSVTNLTTLCFANRPAPIGASLATWPRAIQSPSPFLRSWKQESTWSQLELDQTLKSATRINGFSNGVKHGAVDPRHHSMSASRRRALCAEMAR